MCFCVTTSLLLLHQEHLHDPQSNGAAERSEMSPKGMSDRSRAVGSASGVDVPADRKKSVAVVLLAQFGELVNTLWIPALSKVFWDERTQSLLSLQVVLREACQIRSSSGSRVGFWC